MQSGAESTGGRIGNPSYVRACWLLVLLSTGVSFARLMQAEPLQSANDRSRWCTVRALVEQGTYRIDDVRRLPGWDTIDLVRHEGHFYSTKPPLLSTLVAGVYWCVRQTLGWTLGLQLAETTRLILLLVNLIPWTAALVVFTRLVLRSAATPFAALFVVATACFGTLLLPFVTSLNNHTSAAVSVVFALASAVKIIAGGRREWWRFAAAGLWAGFAFTNELPAAAFVAALGVLLLYASVPRTLLFGVPALLVPVSAFLTLNHAVSGDWLSFYASYGTEKYEFIHEGVPSYWMFPRGIDKAQDSPGAYLLHCTVGHHGVFLLTPVWLLSLAGWAVALLRRDGRTGVNSPVTHSRSERATLTTRLPLSVHAIGMVLTLVVFGYFLTKTEHYNYGGVSVALRWLLWLAPFWLLALIPLLDRWGDRWWLRGVAGLSLAVSVFSAWYPFDGPWKQPWAFQWMERAGWIDYRDPPPRFPRPVQSWVYRLPEGNERQEDYWIELATINPGTAQEVLRLEDGGPADVGGRGARRILATRRGPAEESVTEVYWIDAALFSAGRPPAEFLVWPEGMPAEPQRQAAINVWQGLPRPAPYVSAVDRYLRLPLRRDAFRCRQGYARVAYRADEQSPVHAYRRDVWFSQEVPFGLVQFEDQVIDAGGGVVARQRWRMVATGRFEPPPASGAALE